MDATPREDRAPWRFTGLLVALVYVALCLGLNVLRGAFDSGVGAHDDEAAHFVTGMMVRDWIVQRDPLHPVLFAADFYGHYPKVGIGQWPPVFYVLQALWTLVFGVSTVAVIALMSTLTATVGFVVYRAARPLRAAGATAAGELLAAAAGAFFLLLPEVQVYGSRVMTEMPLALWCTLAVLAFGRYLDGQRARDAFGFGLFSALAILTKGNGLALALVPALAIPLSGRWGVLRRPALWGAGLLVATLCAPWYAVTLGISTGTWAGGTGPTVGYAVRATGFYAAHLVALGGAGAGLLAVVGLTLPFRGAGAGAGAGGGRRGHWAALAAFVPALLAMHVVVPSSMDARHLVLLAPTWVLLAVGGAERMGRLLPVRPAVGTWLVFAAALAIFFTTAFRFPTKHFHGYREVATALLDDPTLDDSVFLVASDAIGEGLFVGAVAEHDDRPHHYALRASKVLGKSDWLGLQYEPRFESVDDLAAYLRKVPVGIALLDRTTIQRAWFLHHELLDELFAVRPTEWVLVSRTDVVRDGVTHSGALEVYRQVDHETWPRSEIDLDVMLGDKLGRSSDD